MSLQDLKKQFIVQESLEKIDIERQIMRVVRFCQVDAQGHVNIKTEIRGKLTAPQKMLCILASRYLGHELQGLLQEEKTIHAEVNVEDLSKMMSEKKSVICARAKDLKDSGKIKADSGIYQILPHAIEDIIIYLESLEANNGG
ncbi:MAG TPA: hypothetical protein HA224_00745 [Nanoarchaeota archaeon]|nr:hypothetical protein [Nanoarchaeota archaeon]